MTLNWKSNYWIKSEPELTVKDFKNGDKVRVIRLSLSKLYPVEMNRTIGAVGVVERNDYTSDEYGPLVEVWFEELEDFWNYFPKDLRKV